MAWRLCAAVVVLLLCSSGAVADTTTFSGCSCLGEWYASQGLLLQGDACASGTSESQGLPWCFVNSSSCSTGPPFSSQARRYQLQGLFTLDWDFCVPANTSSTTQAGCTCLLTWGYGGQSITDGSCLSTDPSDPQSSWCLTAPGTCASSPAGAPTQYHSGWDWCTPPSNTSSNSTATTSAAATTTNNNGNGTAAQPDITLAGCQCAQEWVYGDVLIQGGSCATPDDDPLGAWCRVDVRTCQRTPERVHQANGAWDYCAPLSPLVQLPPSPDNTTARGCQCKVRWSVFPAGGFADNPWLNGCANPDGDPLGDWCAVEADSCTSTPQGNVQSTQQAFDYCSAPTPPSNTPPAQPAPGSNQSPNRTSTAETATTTLAGCSCLREWNFTADNGTVFNFTGGSCGVPDDDPSGPWCYVDAKTCRWQPFGQGVRSLRYWDYCEPAAGPTRSGCRCMKRWTYTAPLTAPITYNGQFANPDDDPLGDWCVVQPQSCTQGLPFDVLRQPPPIQALRPLSTLKPLPQYYDYSQSGNTSANRSSNSSSSLQDLIDAILTPADTLPLIGIPPDESDSEGSDDDEGDDNEDSPSPTQSGGANPTQSGTRAAPPATTGSQPQPPTLPSTTPAPPAPAATAQPSPVTPAPPAAGRSTASTASSNDDDLPY